MQKAGRLWTALAGMAVLAAGLMVGGCNSNAHPDDRSAVYDALVKNDLRPVIVEQDRGKGVITLSGIVGSDAQKTKAESVAQQAAPGYTVTNNIEVTKAGLMPTAKPESDGSGKSAPAPSQPKK